VTYHLYVGKLSAWVMPTRIFRVEFKVKKGQHMNVKNIIGLVEKLFLIIIAIFTVAAMGQEIFSLVASRRVELQDLLLMFIYAEVLGMLAAFYASHRIPITIPLFIAMTALSRLIILQGKDGDPSILLYESGAIILIAGACWVISRVNIAKEDG
jgi:protein PsiE